MDGTKKDNELLDYYVLPFQQQKQQRAENLVELSNALKVYYQSGIENQLLKKLIQSETIIGERYRDVRQTINNILQDYDENSRERIGNLMDETAYLSQLKWIVSAYNSEYIKREEKKEFKLYSEKSKNLPVLVKAVASKKVSFQELEKDEGITSKKIYDIVKKNSELFYLKGDDEQHRLTLTHKGYRYYDFISLPQIEDRETFQKINYNNCRTIIETLNAFIQSEVVTPKVIKLEDLSMLQEKAIKQKYYVLTKKISDIKRKDMTTYCTTQIKSSNIFHNNYIVDKGGKYEGNRNTFKKITW